jgi:uncharacterized membrane protein YfcA
MIEFIRVSLIILAIWFSIVLINDFLKHKNKLENASWLKSGIIGFIVNFFDALGIGSYAPQTALMKFTRQTEDRLLPGTLNVSGAISALLEAFIFITVVKVEPVTLISMLVSAMAGAVLGAGIVSKMSERKIRLTMGIALLITAGSMFARNMNWIEGGGTAIGLYNWKLGIAVVVNFILGALMTVGIGLYAPCMALVYALGMSPQVAFPIMMGSCAFLIPPASVRFINKGAYNRKVSVSMILPSIVAVLIAAFIVKSLPLETLRWLVIVVILYTSVLMLRAGYSNKAPV